MKQKLLTSFTLIASIACILHTPQARGEDAKPGLTIGHFTMTLPDDWKSFSEADRIRTRDQQFASQLAPGLRQYVKEGAPTPKLGDFLGDFVIFQKQPVGQAIGWTLKIPNQKDDFMKTLLKKEQTDFTAQKNLAGGRIKGGQARLFRINNAEVVRVDVEMAEGGKSTNIQFWSPERPDLITVLMLGTRGKSSQETEQQVNAIISSIVIKNKP